LSRQRWGALDCRCQYDLPKGGDLLQWLADSYLNPVSLLLSPVTVVLSVVIVLLLILILAIFVLPGRFIVDLHPLGYPPPGDRLTFKDQFAIRGDHEKRRNDLRIGLLQAIGGLSIVATLVITLLQLHANENQLAAQQELTRRGQIAERLARATGQLGDSNLDTRFGGIYGLEEIGRESKDTDEQVRLETYEILTAYARRHATAGPALRELSGDDPNAELQARAPDVEAIMTVLGRRSLLSTDPRLDLHDLDLRRADLVGAHFEMALLDDSHLENSVLNQSHLGAARLRRTHLTDAVLANAELRGADLENAQLAHANLYGASLQFTDLTAADLSGADLMYVNLDFARLEQANLKGANLEFARLEHANLRGAIADGRTVWPTGFNWRKAALTVGA
jgi:uncharacterized protein YjbI with pentapeptide repeats